MPGLATDQRTFEVNTISTYNVFSACARLGVNKVVWASSETILGLPFDQAPAFAPLDETHPDRPMWSYALAKQLGETMADTFCRLHFELTIASLRFSNVFAPEDYVTLQAAQANPEHRKSNLWAYVDAEDAGEACRLAVEAPLSGHARMIIAAADSLMDHPSSALAARFFPDTERRSGLEGTASFLSSGRPANSLVICQSTHGAIGCNRAKPPYPELLSKAL